MTERLRPAGDPYAGFREPGRETDTERQIRENGERIMREDREGKERRRVEAKKADLNRHLERRSREHRELLDAEPTPELARRWSEEYMDTREIERQADEIERRQGYTPVY